MIVKDARDRRYRLSFRYACQVDSHAQWRWATRAELVPLGALDRPAVDHRTKIRLDGAVVGVAVCSASDQFCRATGREVALDRCLEAFERIASREDATAIRRAWDERPRGEKKADEAEAF